MRARARDGIIESEIGTLAVGRRGVLLAAEWMVGRATAPDFDRRDETVTAFVEAFLKYFRGRDWKEAFNDLPMGDGTPFQCSVWAACRRIPQGETRTYGWIAGDLGLRPVHCRAVGNALRVNPLPIAVPCHRVVAASGVGGYAGARTGALADIKCRLLAFESAARRRPC
jgi:methylated-DNA-[protein]-cysteine S-methyltransferase